MVEVIVHTVTYSVLMMPHKLRVKSATPRMIIINSEWRNTVHKTPLLDASFSQPFMVRKSLPLKGVEMSCSCRSLVHSWINTLDILGHPTMLNRTAEAMSRIVGRNWLIYMRIGTGAMRRLTKALP